MNKHESQLTALKLKAFRQIILLYKLPQIDVILLVYINRYVRTHNEVLKAGLIAKLSNILERGLIQRCEGRRRKYKASTKGLFILSEYYRILDEYYKHITPVLDKSIIDTI